MAAGAQLERAAKTAIAPMRLVRIHRHGIDDPHPGEGQTFLPGEIGNLLGRAKEERVRATPQESRLEQPGDLTVGDRPIRDPPSGRLDLHERLQPVQPPRSVPDQLELHASKHRLGGDTAGDFLRADGYGARVTRYVDPSHRAPRRPSSTLSSRSADILP